MIFVVLARYWLQSSMAASGPGDTLPCVRLHGEMGGQENGQGGERGDSFLCEYNDQDSQEPVFVKIPRRTCISISSSCV